MRPVSVCGVFVALALASACMAQEHEWEVGGAGGFGFMRNATINSPTGSASAGFDNRFAAGVVKAIGDRRELRRRLTGQRRNGRSLCRSEIGEQESTEHRYEQSERTNAVERFHPDPQ